MKILKIIAIVFVIYLIRRFVQLYFAMKKIQEEQIKQQTQNNMRPENTTPKDNIIDADFKNLD